MDVPKHYQLMTTTESGTLEGEDVPSRGHHDPKYWTYVWPQGAEPVLSDVFKGSKYPRWQTSRRVNFQGNLHTDHALSDIPSMLATEALW